MAKDDYHVIACKILSYLYSCLKQCEIPGFEYLTYSTDDFPIQRGYWEYIISHLLSEGYIEGVKTIPVLGRKLPAIRMTTEISIMPRGIEYLQENSAMKKALEFLKTAKEVIPGI